MVYLSLLYSQCDKLQFQEHFLYSSAKFAKHASAERQEGRKNGVEFQIKHVCDILHMFKSWL